MKRILSLTAAILSLSALLSAVQVSATEVSAHSAVLMEYESGDIIFEKNPCEKMSMASTTKIMTAIVVLEAGDCAKKVKISPDACGVEGSSIYLTAGEVISREDLLYALLLESANDAASALAIDIGGSIEGFADMMNKKAAELGLSGTHFSNPHGLDDDEHYTTARDLATLARYCMSNEKFREIVSTKSYRITREGENKVVSLANHNKLLRISDSADGIKTGFTKKSGRCLVSSAERDGVRVIAVTLKAPDDWNDHLRLHGLGFSQYEHRIIAEIGEIELEVPTLSGQTAVLKNRDAVEATVRKGADLSRTVEAPRIIWRGCTEGEAVGHASFYSGDRLLGRVALYAEVGSAE